MTDTTRESLKGFLQRLYPRDPSAAYGLMRTEAHATILALLTRAEAAEAGRDEALNQLDSARHEVDCLKRRCEQWSAERDALAAKLALAVDAGEYLLRAFDAINDRPHRYRADDVFLMVKNGSRIASVYDARVALAKLTADTPACIHMTADMARNCKTCNPHPSVTIPDPRIEGWNAAIEAAAELYEGQFDRLARLIRTMPCPYTPKEGKDDE